MNLEYKSNLIEYKDYIFNRLTLSWGTLDKIKLTNSIRLMNQSNKTNDIIEFIILKELKIFSKYLVKGNYLENKKYNLSLFNLNILYLNYKLKLLGHQLKNRSFYNTRYHQNVFLCERFLILDIYRYSILF